MCSPWTCGKVLAHRITWHPPTVVAKVSVTGAVVTLAPVICHLYEREETYARCFYPALSLILFIFSASAIKNKNFAVEKKIQSHLN